MAQDLEPANANGERPPYADALVGLRGDDVATIIDSVRRGLPFEDVEILVRSGRVTTSEIESIVVSRRNIAARRRDGRLNAAESDRLARTVRIVALAEETFGSIEKAGRWLRRSTRPLDDQAPMTLLDTDAGARRVEALLGRIDHGLAS